MIGRALGLPLAGRTSVSKSSELATAPGDLPATPEPARGLRLSTGLLATLSVPIVLLTAEPRLGPGATMADVAALCLLYLFGSFGAGLVPWHRFGERWQLVLIALPIAFVAGLSALTGGGDSPYSALYAPVLAIAGWYLAFRHAAAAVVLVIATEVWRALALDGSRSIDQLAVALPFSVAITGAALVASTSLRGALTTTRHDQVRMAATLDAIRELGADPDRSVLADLERAMARVFDADVRVIKFGSRRPATADLTARLLERNVTTVIIAGSSKLHGLARLTGKSPFSAHDVRLATILAEVAGRTLDARESISETRAEVDRDALTGLLNRRALDRDLALAMDPDCDQPAGHALLFIDVDRFKALNDQYGHTAGDAVLVRIAGVLRAAARHSDRVYRLGGDEFAILIERSGPAQALRVGKRILGLISAPARRAEDEAVPGFGVSVGVAVSRAGWRTIELLDAADTAMYESKRAGGGTVTLHHAATDEATTD